MTIPTPAEAVTYAVGDLHGEVTLLKQLLDALPLRDQDTIVFLGDYLDRGESSAATVDTLRDLSHRHDGCVFLRGNHEDAWLSHWNGLRFMRAPDIDGAQHVWDEFGGAVPYDFGRWLEKTLIEYEDDHAYYVHAGLLPGRPAWRTPPVLKLWGPAGSDPAAQQDRRRHRRPQDRRPDRGPPPRSRALSGAQGGTLSRRRNVHARVNIPGTAGRDAGGPGAALQDRSPERTQGPAGRGVRPGACAAAGR